MAEIVGYVSLLPEQITARIYLLNKRDEERKFTMTSEISSKAALVLIDVQDAFDDPIYGPRNNPQAENNARELLDLWRASGRPIFHVRHASTEKNSTLRPERAGFAIKKIVEPLPGENIITKHVNSAFIGTDFEQQLRAANISQLVLLGITTDHCVSTTTRMAANLGFEAIVALEATYTFDRISPDGRAWAAEDIHSTALASLHGEFATVLSNAEIVQRAKVTASSAK